MTEQRAVMLLTTDTGREYEGEPSACVANLGGTWLTLENCVTRRPGSGIRTQTVRLESCESAALKKGWG